MRYLRTYEHLNDTPTVGDYVICDENNNVNDNDRIFNYFLSNNLGKCINIVGSEYIIEYDNIPSKIKHYFHVWKGYRSKDKRYKAVTTNCRKMNRNEIIYFSNNKEDCEAYLTAKKYNI